MPAQVPSSFEIKSGQLPMVTLLLRTASREVLSGDLTRQFGPDGESAGFFDHDPLIIDFSQLGEDAELQDLPGLLATLRGCRLVPVAVRGAPPAWADSLRELGLVLAEAEIPRAQRPAAVQPSAPEPAREVIREVPGPATMVLDRPLRSGQKVYARGADLVVMAMVNQGAEVVADGNIHVYAPLRGKAMAGASGNANARIFSLCLEPELISIAGIYRTSETPLPVDIRGKPAQVRLSNDGTDRLLIEALKA